ncbi:WxL domain-containing protein [Enterococcus sp. DIV0213h]|uniref:WxL domain-containing protein n=1 Tax=Enterococcus sp. DIV0213h TaxID=2774669 RepID=UPI003F298E33
MINIRKQAACFGTILLFFQAAPLSLTQAYAETDDAVDPQLVEAFRLHQPEYLNLNQSIIPTETETEAVQEFSFVDKTFRTTVGQPVLLRFTSTLPANEVLVRIPASGQIMEDEFSNGESIQHSHGEYWILKTSKQQTEFILPIVFEAAGQYFLTVDHDADHFYLEVEENRAETSSTESEVHEESDLTEQSEMNTEEQQQESQESDSINDSPTVVHPVMATEKHLSISESLISEEEARILEEITDSQNRTTVTSVSNWSQFRSAWNSSSWYVSIRLTSNINFSSSILGSSLNKLDGFRSRDISSLVGAGVNMGTSGNSLQVENSNLITGTVRIESENSGNQPLIELDKSSHWSINEGTVIINKRNSSAVVINDRSEASPGGGNVRRIIYNQSAVSPVLLSRNSTFDFFVGGIVIGSNSFSNSWVPPISSDANSRIVFSRAASNVMMGGRINVPQPLVPNVVHLTSYRVPWNSVTAEITGVNGSIITSSNSDPNDFSERYLFNYSLVEYRSLTVGATTSEGFVPPISRYNLTLSASPQEAGTPQADNTTIAANTTALIHANPNEGYRFVSWEILSGTGARIADETAESTTFTMGSSDVVVQANYEEEATDVRPVDPLEPDKEVDPENPPQLPEDQGLFSIDFVSQFDFGVQAISAQDQTYYAKPQRLLADDGTVLEGEERPNYVQVSDRRSTQERDGWELSVRQNDPFTNRETGEELTGARLILQNQQIATAQGGTAPGLAHTNPMTLNPGGAKRTLLKAQGPEGEGTWIYRFGDADSADKSVALEVPRGATPSATSYQTTLTWELSSVPDN